MKKTSPGKRKCSKKKKKKKKRERKAATFCCKVEKRGEGIGG
jgi:hypothetical protein